MLTDRRHFLLAAAALTCGCQSVWTTAPSELPSLPVPGLAPDSVVLEVCTLRYPVDQSALVNDLWQSCDESAIGSDLRRDLSEAGFRAGVLGQQTPPALEKLLAATDESKQRQASGEKSGSPEDSEQTLTDLDPAKLGRAERQRIHSRAGQRAEVLATDLRAKVTVLQRIEGKVAGREFREAQCVLALVSQPLGDGRARIDVTPEVHHGAPKQRDIGQQGVFALNHGRDRETFAGLRVAATLAPGETLVLAAIPDPIGLGREFFIDPAAQPPEGKLVLIRVAQTQYDDLFAPERVVKPVATLE